MGAAGAITVVTSIPPKLTRMHRGQNIGLQYQMDCVASWQAAGLRVVSVNPPAEIPELAPRYPMIEFVPTDLDASAVARRKTPLIAGLLDVLAAQEADVVGVINADLCLAATRNWSEAIRGALTPGAALIGHRWDADTWSTTSGRIDARCRLYAGGFDLFFFERSAITPALLAEARRRGFAMGMPWWDFWLPMALGLEGCRIGLLQDLVAGHFAHPTNYDPAMWDYFGAQFIDSIVEAAGPGVSVAPELRPVVAQARQLHPRAEKELRLGGPRPLADREDMWFKRYRVNLEQFCGLTVNTLRGGVTGTRDVATA